MPDITMCFPEECDKKETCHRYKAAPDVYQSYCDFSIYKTEDECQYYYKVRNDTNE